MPRFSLLVVSSLDGFIARAPGHGPWEWASAEEQAIFFEEVGAADWAVMGRGTHEAAPKPERRRIVFSHQPGAPEWRLPNHLWLNPAGLAPDDLAALVAGNHAMRQAVVLGGTPVHDWFHVHGRLDRVVLTVEPVRFGQGLPIFTRQQEGDAEAVFPARGYRETGRRLLNAQGTRLIEYLPDHAAFTQP